MSDVRVGIAGYGIAGEVFHAPLVDAVEGLEVAGIVTSSPERRERARAAYPGAAVVADLDALWDHIDMLVVAAPNRAHVPLALAALERELAVVVDKPLAPSAAEAERLVAAGGALTVALGRRVPHGSAAGLRGGARAGRALRVALRALPPRRPG